ncbi:transporter substrate-binding domain-containing protein [Shewanella sp. JM162201]|uniref:Transporter substrate-binding domain-containing protein n=1 Tax=Shewanella jiangmenensis TaxID=2837387 RepID=A0ABS5V1C2_9GAMM|nr:transporter substrate-binding domain-containing protein [Shewanella jiangmenensis]
MVWGLRLFILFQALLATLAIATEAPSSIRIAAEDSWPPFADADGDGLSHRLIQKAFALQGVKVDTLVVPYNRGLILTEQGKVNAVFNVARQQSTESRFLFGREPLFKTTASFYQLKNRERVAADKWSLPPGTRVGIIRGYEYGDEFDRLSNMELHIHDNQYQLLNLLLTHKLDMVVMYDEVAEQFLSRTGVTNEVMAVFPNHTSELFLAFNKEDKDSAALIRALDLGLEQLREQGEYRKLLSEAGIAAQRH